jgi:hypothetical protein
VTLLNGSFRFHRTAAMGLLATVAVRPFPVSQRCHRKRTCCGSFVSAFQSTVATVPRDSKDLRILLRSDESGLRGAIGLELLRPETHRQLAEHLGCRTELMLRLVAAADAIQQQTAASVAASGERPHAELCCEGKCIDIILFGRRRSLTGQLQSLERRSETCPDWTFEPPTRVTDRQALCRQWRYFATNRRNLSPPP